VLTCIRELEKERLADERDLAPSSETAEPLSEAAVRALVRTQRKVLRSLAKATLRATGHHVPRVWVADHHNPAEPDCVVVEIVSCTNRPPDGAPARRLGRPSPDDLRQAFVGEFT
jgi:hypothetical protein